MTDTEKTRMDCRMPGCNNFCMVDRIPTSHWSFQCPECIAHEEAQDLDRQWQTEQSRRAMLGRTSER